MSQGLRSPVTPVLDDWDPPCRFWDLNPRPLEKQSVLAPAPGKLEAKFYITFTYVNVYVCM